MKYNQEKGKIIVKIEKSEIAGNKKSPEEAKKQKNELIEKGKIQKKEFIEKGKIQKKELVEKAREKSNELKESFLKNIKKFKVYSPDTYALNIDK